MLEIVVRISFCLLVKLLDDAVRNVVVDGRILFLRVGRAWFVLGDSE